MEKARPLKKDARSRYLEAAKDLFIKNGYKGTSIRMIGSAVGYNQSNFYVYWKSKDSLFREITDCIKTESLSEACEFPVEYAMVVEKRLSSNGTLIKKLSELNPELLVSML